MNRFVLGAVALLAAAPAVASPAPALIDVGPTISDPVSVEQKVVEATELPVLGLRACRLMPAFSSPQVPLRTVLAALATQAGQTYAIGPEAIVFSDWHPTRHPSAALSKMLATHVTVVRTDPISTPDLVAMLTSLTGVAIQGLVTPDDERRIPLNWKGRFDKMLDMLAGELGKTWDANGDTVTFADAPCSRRNP